MQTKRIRIIFLTLMCAVILLRTYPLEAQAVTQADIAAAEQRRDAISAQREAAQAVVDRLEQEQASVLERKAAVDERNVYTLRQLKLVGEEIELYDRLIEEKAAEVEEAQRLERQQLELYRSRVRAMEEKGGYDILGIILRADNLSALLSALDDMADIMANDKRIEKEYEAAKEYAQRLQLEYEGYKLELQGKQDILRREQRLLEAELEEANGLLADLEQQLLENSDLLRELEAQEQSLSEELAALIARREEERRQQQQQQISAGNISSGYTGGTVTGSGSFIWPVSCTYITSCVGYRFHPVSGIWKYHAGMDIGSAYGDAIWASDSGTVCSAGEKGGYGQCVMIDHGNGYYSLYGHMSAIAVSLNQTVSQGDTIGYVGNSGVTTGPHLHFEFRDSSGGAIDFMGWFSGLSFAPDSGG